MGGHLWRMETKMEATIYGLGVEGLGFWGLGF